MKSIFSLVFASLLLAAHAFAADVRKVEIVAKDGIFTPSDVEMTAGEKIELIVKNMGTDAEEFESHDLKREKIIPPGKSATIKLGPLKAGTYGFFGEFHPQTAKGKVIVKEAAQ